MIKLKTIVKEIFDVNLLENNNEIIIFCDMDGVLCDFDKQFKQLTKTDPKEFESKHGNLEFWRVILEEGEKYWSTMTPMKGFDHFKKELTDISKDGRFILKFLTSTNAAKLLNYFEKPKAIEYIKNIELGKRIWLRDNWSGPKNIIFSDSGKGKAKYATPNSILIDDLSPNIEAFIAAGGTGIIFTSAQQAIDELKAKIKI